MIARSAFAVRGAKDTVSSPALCRLAALAPIDHAARAALAEAIAGAQLVPARREIVTEGSPVPEARLITGGWAARTRLLADGRRQFLSFLLPGDVFGAYDHPAPLAIATVLALTDVTVCPAPSPRKWPGLARNYAISRAWDEAYLLAQITRLGRLTARERLGDLLLELLERLQLAGLAGPSGFELPLTQEVLADVLGLTPVHVNRMVQLARKNDGLLWQRGRLTLDDPAALAIRVGRAPIKVSAHPAA